MQIFSVLITFYSVVYSEGSRYAKRPSADRPAFFPHSSVFHKDSIDGEHFVPTQPKLRFIYEGSSDNPELIVHFNDGDMRRAILRRFDPLNLSEDRAFSTKKHCHYIGELRSGGKTNLGITGCPGDKDIQITMISRSINAQYSLNGETEEMTEIPSPWKRGKVQDIPMKKNFTEDEIFHDEIESSALEASKICSSSSNLLSGCSIPASHKMTIKIGYDSTLAAKEPNTLSWISGVMTHTQAFLLDPSLPTRINLEVLGQPKYYSNEVWKAETSITSVEKYAAGDTNTNLYVFLCADSNYHGTVGIAYVGGLCDLSGYQVSINEWRSTQAETAKVVAHEIGHNMGMSHDFDPKHASKGCTGIMDYGETPDTWSDCSQRDFKSHYEAITLSGKSHCMKVLSDDGEDSSTNSCAHQHLKGDGYCDDANNLIECDFDGGDCCNNHKPEWNSFCKDCKCFEPEQGNCGNPSWKGDGFCDDGNNVPECDYDGGDCCHNTIPYAYQFCKSCECLDPKQGCKYPKYQNDNYCDDDNNYIGCGFDGGDCCKKAIQNWDSYCTECRCKTP